MRVLIIEQERTFGQSLAQYFGGQKNMEVHLARSKNEGMSLLHKIPFDVVLCGDRLPDGSGLGMLQDLVKQKPQIISILMTVQSDDAAKQEALRVGIRGYLEKPFNLTQLEDLLGLNLR